jgi:glycerol-3-phosphate dehydrogenase
LKANARRRGPNGAFLPGGDLSAWIGPAQRPDTDFARFVDRPWRCATPDCRPTPLARVGIARAYGQRIRAALLGSTRPRK